MTLVGDNRSVNEEYQADASVYWGKGESHEFSKKSMKTCCTQWVVTIIAQKVITVGEKRLFLSDSKKHEI